MRKNCLMQEEGEFSGIMVCDTVTYQSSRNNTVEFNEDPVNEQTREKQGS